MDRSFQLQEQKKNRLNRLGGPRSTALLGNKAINPLHLTILSMQQNYGNRYVQEIVSGERMPCQELCGLREPLTASSTRTSGQFKPHSCDSCMFHPQRSVKQMLSGTSPSKPNQPIQAKLTIGQPGDVYEQEADRTADLILQRQCTTPECEEEEKVRMQPITPIAQRQTKDEEEEPVRMKQIDAGSERSQDITEQILQQRGSGRPIEPATRKFMESGFGYGFDGVRVHTDGRAEEMARNLNAEAFTVGRDVYFGSGRYNPASTEGKRLLSHELTHVVQQNVSHYSALVQREQNSTDRPSSERVWGFIVTRSMCPCQPQIRDDINWRSEAIEIYQSCDMPAFTSGAEVDNCFDNEVINRYGAPPTIVAVTSPSGEITPPPPATNPCERILNRSYMVHETFHARRGDRIARNIGGAFFTEWNNLRGVPNRLTILQTTFPTQTAEYERQWGAARGWVSMEVEGYNRQWQFLADVRRALSRICS